MNLLYLFYKTNFSAFLKLLINEILVIIRRTMSAFALSSSSKEESSRVP
jgi:hypothetical protein